MRSATLADLLSCFNGLRMAKTHYCLNHCRDDAILVEISVPDERSEIEFLDNGSMEVEAFRSDGEIHDVAVLAQLTAKDTD